MTIFADTWDYASDFNRSFWISGQARNDSAGELSSFWHAKNLDFDAAEIYV